MQMGQLHWIPLEKFPQVIEITYPIDRRKVNGFGKIKTLVKASVVGTRECDDEFAAVLVNLSMRASKDLGNW